MIDLLRLIFSSVTIISALVFLGLIILIHFLPNKYNPIKNTVSDYSITPSSKRRGLYIAIPSAGALSSFSLAIVTATTFKTVSIIVLLLIISSIFRFFLIFFPTDITGQQSTKKGKLHLLFAMIAFASIAFAAGNFHITVADEIISQMVIFTAVLLLFGFLPPLKKIFGLLERIFLLSSIVWLVVMGFELLLKF
jgi:Protein of unknown function (DUF998)